MKFCPKCEVRLRKSDSGLSCPKCNYTEGISQDTKKIIEDQSSGLKVLDETDEKISLPTIKIDCEKCGHTEAVWWMLQTRSADEPTTQFYRCTKCNFTWRNYA